MRLREWIREPAVVRGAAVGLAVAGAFLVVHAALIAPIWIDGLRGVPVAILAGAVAGGAVARALPHLPGPPWWRGAAFGILAGILPLAAVPAGLARADGAPFAEWSLLLAGALVVWLAVVLAAARAAAGWIVLAGAVANALPIVFVVFTTDLVDLDRAPQPVPIATALFVLEVAAGMALAMLAQRDRAHRDDVAMT